MSTQPILLVIGVAIAANLVIMAVLVLTLLTRRREQVAGPGEISEPATSRLAGVAGPPTIIGSAPGLFIDDRPAPAGSERVPTASEQVPASEVRSDTVNAAEPSDIRRFRPDMTDEGHRGDATIASFFSGGSTGQAVAEPSARDAQTGLDGPLNWEFRLRDEDARFARYRRAVSVVMVELEGLDRLLARFGSDAAERIVPPVGQTLLRQARATDHVARIGDGRFAILLPETDEVQAINYVERVRSECDRWLAAGAVSMRLAIGWASPAPGSGLTAAIRVAEDRLNGDRRRPAATEDAPTGDIAAEVPETPRTGREDAYQAGSTRGIDLTPPKGDDARA
jgi:diguanylate cyclase (GGDEF)-like protein